MDRRRALAVSLVIAMVVVAVGALAANFGLLGLVDRVEPVGQLSPVAPVGSTAVPRQQATPGEGTVGDGGLSGTPGVEVPPETGRGDDRKTEHREPEPEPEHERDD